jgi:hypothetical protein
MVKKQNIAWGRIEIHTRPWREMQKNLDHLEDARIEGIITKIIWKKQGGKVWTGLIWLKIGRSGDKHKNEPAVSIKSGYFLTS